VLLVPRRNWNIRRQVQSFVHLGRDSMVKVLAMLHNNEKLAWRLS
jgi:hypothetical protein